MGYEYYFFIEHQSSSVSYLSAHKSVKLFSEEVMPAFA